MRVPRGDISRLIEASGTISEARQADLAFTSSGRVQRVYMQLGDYIVERRPSVGPDGKCPVGACSAQGSECLRVGQDQLGLPTHCVKQSLI